MRAVAVKLMVDRMVDIQIVRMIEWYKNKVKDRHLTTCLIMLENTEAPTLMLTNSYIASLSLAAYDDAWTVCAPSFFMSPSQIFPPQTAALFFFE